jgi:hypothetical protein
MRTDSFICEHLGISMAVLYRIKDILDESRGDAFEREVHDKIREIIGMAAIPMKSKGIWIIRVPTIAGAN